MNSPTIRHSLRRRNPLLNTLHPCETTKKSEQEDNLTRSPEEPLSEKRTQGIRHRIVSLNTSRRKKKEKKKRDLQHPCPGSIRPRIKKRTQTEVKPRRRKKLRLSPAYYFPALGQSSILSYLGELTSSAATKYDKALDAIYLDTHIGGGYHRLFDGGHDLFGAWKRVSEVSQDDTFTEQTMGYVSALWKDVTTTRGLPFATVSKESFDVWVDKLSVIPGVNRAYLSDLLSFDAMEILSSSLGMVGALLCLRNEDEQQLSKYLASMGITSVISANPLMGIMIIATTAYGYAVKKMEIQKTTVLKSSVSTCLSMSLFTILGFPLFLNLVVVGVISHLVTSYVLDNDKLHRIVKSYVPSGKKLSEVLPARDVLQTFLSEQKEKILSFSPLRKSN